VRPASGTGAVRRAGSPFVARSAPLVDLPLRTVSAACNLRSAIVQREEIIDGS